MRIVFLSTRINGLDGVTLEIKKWATILSEMGHEIFYCAGELDESLNGFLIPEMHFQYPAITEINRSVFGQGERSSQVTQAIDEYSHLLKKKIHEFIHEQHIQVIIAENILSIPMNIPLGVALSQLIEEEGIPTIAHHHDFYWERERFLQNSIPEILQANFPPQSEHIVHVVINSLAKQNLKERMNVQAEVIPNIFDFRKEPVVDVQIKKRVRGQLQISTNDLMVLQPTRIIPRKGIELAIDLAAKLREPAIRERIKGREAKLVLSHPSGDEGHTYLNMLVKKAAELNVPLIQAASVFHGLNSPFQLWDAYQAADLVTYPSYIEGFGNALLEAVYFKKILVVNRYPVYERDIRPLGFDFIELDGQINDDIIERIVEALHDPELSRNMVEKNYSLAERYFSYEAVKPRFDKIIGILKTDTCKM